MIGQGIKELTLSREFDAPRDLVYKAWTDEKLVAQWWGPHGFTIPVSELDVRPGGAIDIVMEDAEGMVEKGGRYPMAGNYEEVVAPEKLVFTASAIVHDTPVMDTRTTVNFEEVNGKTKVTIHIEVTRVTPEAEGPLAGMEMGWNQQLDKLVSLLSSER